MVDVGAWSIQLEDYLETALSDFTLALILTPDYLDPLRERGMFLYYLYEADGDEENVYLALIDLMAYSEQVDELEDAVEDAIATLSAIVLEEPDITLTFAIELTSTPVPTPTVSIDTLSNSATYLVTQAEESYLNGFYTQAITTLSDAIMLSPTAELYYLRGRSFRARNNSRQDLRTAIINFDTALELDPELYIAYRERGLANFELCESFDTYCAPAQSDLTTYLENVDTTDQEVMNALADLEERLNNG